jgi:5-formyltetrahydrofolate cyclo-ligase
VSCAEDKQALRRRVAEQLAALDPQMKHAASADLCVKVAADPAWRSAGSVLLFLPMASEPDVTGLMLSAWRDGKTVAVPRVAGAALELVRLDDLNDVRPAARFKALIEPAGNELVTKVDFALVPGVAFTADGQRLGRGGGFYDRLLPTLRCGSLGACFDLQVRDWLPVEPHDARVDRVVTASTSST